MIRHLCFALLATLWVVSGRAQGPGRMTVRSFGASDGLPEGFIYGLCQDRQGRYWVAAEHGVYVGDGTTFLKTPCGPPGDRPQFRAITEDAEGRILLLGESGFYVLEGETWRAVGEGLAPRPRQSPLGFHRDGAGTLWLGWGAHLYRILGPDRYVEAPLPSPRATVLSPRPRQGGLIARDGGQAWIGEGSTWRPLPDLHPRQGEEFRSPIAEDAHGTLWTATYQRTFRLDPGGSAWVQVTDPEGNEGFAGGVCALGGGEVWLMGNQSARRIDRHEPSLETTAAFSVFSMHLLLRDREGWLWGDRNGLQRLGGPWRVHAGENGLASFGAWQSLRDTHGHLWLSGTAGLFRSNGTRWERVWKAGLHSQIALGADGCLWASEFGSGRVLRFETRAEHPVPTPLPPALQGRQAIRGLSAGGGHLAVPTREGAILFGTWAQGTWSWKNLVAPGAPNTLRTFTNPSGHVLVAGVAAGRVQLSEDGGPWTDLTPAIDGRVPTDIKVDGDRLLLTWFIPPVLDSYVRSGRGWKLEQHLELDQRSPCTAAYGVDRVGHGRLWVLTDHGVLELDPSRPDRARHFTAQEGLPMDDCNQYGLFVEADRIWVSTGTGLACYDRHDEAFRPEVPGPVLLGARTGEGAWNLGVREALPSGTRALTLQLGVPSPTLKAHLRYQWRDLERDGAWQAFEGPTLSFLDPAPGAHRIQVRCLEPGGHPSAEWSMPFNVLRPWWQRPWALALWVLVALALPLLLHRLRLRSIERRNEELAHLVEERTAALAASEERERGASRAKSAFLADMSHELRTPLNAILLYSELIQQDAEEVGQTAIARDSGRLLASGQHLISLLNGILDLSKIEAGKMEVMMEAVHMKTLLQEVMATLKPLAVQRRDALALEVPDETLELHTDGLKLKQVLINLGGNAVKFTEDGTVTLAAHRQAEGVRLEVRDTGIGLTEDQVARLFQAYEQPAQSRAGGTGLGLTISKKFIELLGGRIEVTSEPRKGTTFYIHLPASTQAE